MAMGTPVICLDVAGPGMHINETCGIKIVPVSFEQSVQQMAHALIRLFEGVLLRNELGRGARRRAEPVSSLQVAVVVAVAVAPMGPAHLEAPAAGRPAN